MKIVKDGNCGPRAISVFVWGRQDKFKTVREDVYLSQVKKLKEAHKDSSDTLAFKSKLKSILNMRKDKTWFTDIELQECSNLYNLDIVLFSVLHEMRFMDSLITPFAPDVSKIRVPCYLLHHDFHYTVLRHRF